MTKLEPSEIELRGSWVPIGSSFYADDECERIESLITSYLIEIAEDESGWYKLYQDPEDRRYWELLYPEAEMHGGGPPVLRNIAVQEAKQRYELPLI